VAYTSCLPNFTTLIKNFGILASKDSFNDLVVHSFDFEPNW